MSYQVKIAPSGYVFNVNEGEYIVTAALDNGITFPYGCRSGVCGTCFGKVLSGEVFYPNDLPMALSEEEHEAGEALFCQAVAKSDLHIEVGEIKMASDITVKIKTLPVKITSLRKLADDVMQMTLKLPETEPFVFRAGQYVDILLNDGRRRAFSLATPATTNDKFLELHIRHVKDGEFTSRVFEQLQEKDLLRIEGPHGNFFLRPSQRPKILLGGGTGFAPLKGMIEQEIEEGVNTPLHLYWGVRSAKDLYAKELAEKWVLQYDNITFIPVLSEPEDTDNWKGRTGFVHLAVIDDFADLSGFDVYMSGPPPMVNAAGTAFKKQGAIDEQMFSDSFEFGADIQKKLAP
jgi:CDP-4-dehydro-6-deoxyglucose reductase